MEKFIEVYDNFLDSSIENELENLALGPLPWKYVKNIALENSHTHSPGHNCTFLDKLNPQRIDPNNLLFSYFLLNPLYYLASKASIVVKDIITARSFMHLPSPNPGPDIIHVDTPSPHWVGLYYVNDSDGDTILFEDDKITELKRVTPKKGRMVFFDGSINHCSSRPANNTRVVLNYDFLGYRIGNKEKN